MIPFNKVRNSSILGLDDQFGFGKYPRLTVLEVIHEDPTYIEWLMKNTNIEFYQSVPDEMWHIKQEQDVKKPVYKSNYIEDEYEFDDIPF